MGNHKQRADSKVDCNTLNILSYIMPLTILKDINSKN